jgi:hypothetical protein
MRVEERNGSQKAKKTTKRLKKVKKLEATKPLAKRSG